MPKLKTQSAEPKTQGDLRGHNTRMQLLSYVERFERLQEERDGLGDDQKEVMKEAKGLGFDTKILRKAIQRRKMDKAQRDEADSMLELYEDVIREAEKQQISQSVDEGAGPAPEPKAKKFWGKSKQMDVEELAPSDNEVEAKAAADIGHAADHPEA